MYGLLSLEMQRLLYTLQNWLFQAIEDHLLPSLCSALARLDSTVASRWLPISNFCGHLLSCPSYPGLFYLSSWHSLWLGRHSLWLACFSHMNQWLWPREEWADGLNTTQNQPWNWGPARGEEVAILSVSWQSGGGTSSPTWISGYLRGDRWLLGWQPTMASVFRLGLVGHTHSRRTGRELTLRVPTVCWALCRAFYRYDRIDTLLQPSDVVLSHLHSTFEEVEAQRGDELDEARFSLLL